MAKDPRRRSGRNDRAQQRFRVVVERDPESAWLVGEVVELPGCYTQAPDLPTLETNVQEAIRAYLKTAQPEKPLPDFIGTLRVEVAVWAGSASRRIAT